MLSSAIPYTSGKELKEREREMEDCGRRGCVGVVMEESIRGESVDCSGTSMGTKRLGVEVVGGIWCGVSWSSCCSSFDSRLNEWSFPCAHCSAAIGGSAAVSLIARQEGGKGWEEGEEGGGWLQWYSLPASKPGCTGEKMGSQPQSAQQLAPLTLELSKASQRRQEDNRVLGLCRN